MREVNIIFSVFCHVDLEYKRKKTFTLKKKKVAEGELKSPEFNKHSDVFLGFVTRPLRFWITRCSGATQAPATPTAISQAQVDLTDLQLQDLH